VFYVFYWFYIFKQFMKRLKFLDAPQNVIREAAHL